MAVKAAKFLGVLAAIAVFAFVALVAAGGFVDQRRAPLDWSKIQGSSVPVQSP